MPAKSKAQLPCVALLRGINVGGKNRLPMKDLAAMFTGAGASDVSTYIQSGNVAFKATPALIDRIPDLITLQIEKQFKLRVPVILRTGDELAATAAANPFLGPSADLDQLSVMFLATAPTPASVADLDPQRSPPDEFVVRGREVYLRFPNGQGKSKLTNEYFDRKLETTGTVRNWRTLQKLIELTRG